MFQQWNTIKNFNIMYSSLLHEVKKKIISFDNLKKNYEELLRNIEKKDKEDMEKNLMKFQEDIVYTKLERQKRIKRYLEKKKKRNKRYFIRYEIRKTLANNRLRSKGKFVKNKKIDINKLIEMVKKGKHLIKRATIR